ALGRGVRRLRARHPHPEGDRSHAAPSRSGDTVRHGAGQRRDHEAPGRDRAGPGVPARAGRPSRGAPEDPRRGTAVRRGPPATDRHHPSPGQALLAGGREVHRVPAGAMSWRRAAALLALVLTVAGCGGRTRVMRDTSGAACMRLSSERQVRGETLCEDVFTCIRPPGGLVDRIGLRRLALCSGATGPVVLFLPGMHMNGQLASTDARYDLRLYLAQAGIRAWSLDYRTHNLPPHATPAQPTPLPTC